MVAAARCSVAGASEPSTSCGLRPIALPKPVRIDNAVAPIGGAPGAGPAASVLDGGAVDDGVNGDVVIARFAGRIVLGVDAMTDGATACVASCADAGCGCRLWACAGDGAGVGVTSCAVASVGNNVIS